MSGPLLWSVSPIIGESLMSLVTRAAARNLLPSSHVLLAQVGAPHAQNPTVAVSPLIDCDRLAAILGMPVDEVAARRHPVSGQDGYVEHFGSAVRADEIVFRRRRFAPTSIGRSAHARALWSLKAVPCCTESWEYLEDRCRCGAVQGWRYAEKLDRCDLCNMDLGRIDAVPVAPGIRDGLSFIIGLLDPHPERRDAARRRLPEPLTAWDGGIVFELALALMPLTPSRHRPLRGTQPASEYQQHYAASLAEAGSLILDWPRSIVPALEQAVHEHGRSRTNVRYPGVGHYVAGLDGDITPAPVVDAIEKVLASISGDQEDAVDMRRATRITGHVEHDLAMARRAGHLRTRVAIRGARVMPMLDRGELDTVSDFLRNRLGTDRAATLLGLPAYAMRLLADEGLIAFEAHPYLVECYGEYQIHAARLADLEESLRRMALPNDAISQPIKLQRAARGIGGGPKPWGRIVQDMLHGRTLFSMSGRRIVDAVIEGASAREMQSLDLVPTISPFAEGTCSQRDAVEILNLPLKHAHLIADGTTGAKSGAWSVGWERLLHTARTRITLAELQARTGLHGTRLEGLLDRRKVFRVDKLGWKRSEALSAIKLL